MEQIQIPSGRVYKSPRTVYKYFDPVYKCFDRLSSCALGPPPTTTTSDGTLQINPFGIQIHVVFAGRDVRERKKTPSLETSEGGSGAQGKGKGAARRSKHRGHKRCHGVLAFRL
jgi:hypothetical protein